MKRIASLLSVGLLLIAGVSACSEAYTTNREAPATASAALVTKNCGSITALHAVGDVWLASQPQPADFALLEQRGVKTVINLRGPGEIQDFDEQQVVRAAGMGYLSIPIRGAADLTDAVFDTVRSELKNANGALLLHCASANRVGAVWLPYRVLDGGVSYPDALAEAKTVGLKSSELEAKARSYIERHK